jgi:DNA-binding XRE family transcriptional regulator
VLRKDYLKMTQQELAKQLKCSRSKVSFAENHPEEMSLEYWYQFAALLGLELQAPTFACLEERREEALKRYKPWWKRLWSHLVELEEDYV